jgi:hypothetical protein
MKKILILLTSVILTSCQKEDDQIQKTLINGTWEITNYIDSGSDETYYFTGYTFNFNSDGGLVATVNSNGVVGNWSQSDDDSSDKLNIIFDQAPLNELNDDWDIIVISGSTIELKDISSDGETDFLKFNKK